MLRPKAQYARVIQSAAHRAHAVHVAQNIVAADFKESDRFDHLIC